MLFLVAFRLVFFFEDVWILNLDLSQAIFNEFRKMCWGIVVLTAA